MRDKWATLCLCTTFASFFDLYKGGGRNFSNFNIDEKWILKNINIIERLLIFEPNFVCPRAQFKSFHLSCGCGLVFSCYQILYVGGSGNKTTLGLFTEVSNGNYNVLPTYYKHHKDLGNLFFLRRSSPSRTGRNHRPHG